MKITIEFEPDQFIDIKQMQTQIVFALIKAAEELINPKETNDTPKPN